MDKAVILYRFVSHWSVRNFNEAIAFLSWMCNLVYA
jgi:hypothetical protein